MSFPFLKKSKTNKQTKENKKKEIKRQGSSRWGRLQLKITLGINFVQKSYLLGVSSVRV